MTLGKKKIMGNGDGGNLMDDLEFFELLMPGEHFWLYRARREDAKGMLSASERKTYVDFITRLRAHLLEMRFPDETAFVRFKNSYLGYVEAAFMADGGADFLRAWLRCAENPIGIRLCLVNLFERLRNPGNWEAMPDNLERLEEKMRGRDDAEVVGYLLSGKIMAGTLCRMAMRIERRSPGLLAARLEDYANTGDF